MNEQPTPRIFREYCWFALLLLVLTVGIVGRPQLGGPSAPRSAAGESSAPPAHHSE